MDTSNSVTNTTPAGRIALKIPNRVHREIKIESAYGGKDMGDLVADAWDLYKTAVPQAWRDVRGKKAGR